MLNLIKKGGNTMTKVKLEAGICGFVTLIEAQQDDDGMVVFKCTTGCPNIKRAFEKFPDCMDPMTECFKDLHETEIFQTLLPELPHISCPSCSAFLKALEIEGGLALARDAHITIT